jgi:Protein of unknown function (DUF2829)
MDVVSEYLSKIQKVKGIYVLELDWDVSDEDLQSIVEGWKELEKNGEIEGSLVMLPKGSSLTYEDHFTFERAIQLLRAGGKLRRRIWATADRYLFMNTYGIITKYQNGIVQSYSMNRTDMEAVDWVLYGEEN